MKKSSVRRSHIGREKENEKSKGPTTIKQMGTHIPAGIPQPQLGETF